MSEPTPSFESASVTAWLVERSRADQKDLLDELVTTLSGAVPGTLVERSLLRRRVTAVRIPLGGFVYVLEKHADGSYQAVRQQVVRGVAVRSIPMEIEAFLSELGLALDAELRRTERGHAALEAFLRSESRSPLREQSFAGFSPQGALYGLRAGRWHPVVTFNDKG